MKNILLILSLFCAISVNAQAPAMWAQSRIETDSVYSNTLKAWRHYNVFIPKSFDANPNQKYPILYLLHGMSDNHLSWSFRGHIKDVMDQLVASGETDEMIIVTPNAGGRINEDWNGYFNMPGWNYDDFFFNEFMPTVEKKYRVIGEKKYRAIAGLSMGGGGCTSYAQHHPELFNCAYAMSALMDIPQVSPVSKNSEGTDMLSLLTKSVMDRSCIKYVQNADDATKEALRSVAWWVDCGDDDFLLDRNIEFVQAMHNAQIPVEFRVRDGGHTWEYWHSALYTCLPWIKRNFDKK
jgi:enterochelin esterase-like enzyme